MNPHIKEILINELAPVLRMWTDEKEILVAMRLTDDDIKAAATAAIDEIECTGESK